jgi:hypothetical protein
MSSNITSLNGNRRRRCARPSSVIVNYQGARCDLIFTSADYTLPLDVPRYAAKQLEDDLARRPGSEPEILMSFIAKWAKHPDN